jgi:hypothetical protein
VCVRGRCFDAFYLVFCFELPVSGFVCVLVDSNCGRLLALAKDEMGKEPEST